MRAAVAGLVAAAALAAVAATAGRSLAQWSFEVDDRVVSNDTKSIIDPEFDNIGWRITFQDGSDKLWVGQIDSILGQLTPPSGRGVLADSLVARVTVNGVSNGPEWAYSRRGPEIFYTDLIGDDVPAIASLLLVDSVWTHAVHDSSGYRALPIASKDTSFDRPYVTYLYLVDYGLGQPAWRVAGSLSSELFLPIGSAAGGGRWINGQHAFMTLGTDVNGVMQAVRYDCDTQSFTQLTFDAGDKSEPWMVPAPEFPGEYFLICLVQSESTLAVYRRIDSVWTRVKDIRPPSPYPYLLSPEPFTFEGRSYAALQCSATPDQDNALSDMWIVTLAPGRQFHRLVTDSTALMARRDPEPFRLSDGPVIYYTEVFGTQHILHRCTTGLSTFPPTAVGDEARPPHVALDAPRPLPSAGRVTLGYSLETAAPVRLVILSSAGRFVAGVADGPKPAGPGWAAWDGRDAAGHLVPSGVYLAVLEAGGARTTRRIVVTR